jgi:hypothetical protein
VKAGKKKKIVVRLVNKGYSYISGVVLKDGKPVPVTLVFKNSELKVIPYNPSVDKKFSALLKEGEYELIILGEKTILKKYRLKLKEGKKYRLKIEIK